MNNQQKYRAYYYAQNRVAKERAFYKHLATYVVINVLIIIFKIQVANQIDNEVFHKYLIWNLIATPVLWGIVLLGHGLWTFREQNGLGKLFQKSVFNKEWEEKKIKELLDNQS